MCLARTGFLRTWFLSGNEERQYNAVDGRLGAWASRPQIFRCGRGARAPMIPTDDEDDAPGVPGFRRWRGVYLFVFVVFVLTVVFLAIFSRVYA